MSNKKYQIVVIGAGPAAVVSALTAKKYYPDKSVLLVKKYEIGVIPCGIPYMFYSLSAPEKNIMSYDPLIKNGVDVLTDEAIELDRTKKTVKTLGGDVIDFEKLILALGSKPITLNIPGFDLKGVFPIKKEFNYLKEVVDWVKRSKRILILGGGFIGVEFADELANYKDKEIVLVELRPAILANSFDSEFSGLARERLRAKGVKVLTDTKVLGFEGKDGVVKYVELSNGQSLEIDCVISGIGALPNTDLAVAAGLDIGKGKGVWVDEYMRTSDLDIFAIGDCAGKRDFFTRRDLSVMLASTATAEARIAGASLYKIKVVRENKGTIAVFSTFIDGLALGSAGMTESFAKSAGFEVVVGNAEAVDKHPAALPGASKVKVKLIFAEQSGIILGGQVAGGTSAGELINIIGMAIQKKVSINELEMLQMATHPYLTSAPTVYPIVAAAIDAGKKL